MPSMRRPRTAVFSWLTIPAALALALMACSRAPAAEELPNILWLTCEDIGPHLGCYGDDYASTPNLDALADRGLRYTTAWSDAPVCAPARTAIITGVYPTATGSEHMRSMVAVPEFLRMYPQILRERGYYCTNNAKTDYNVATEGRVWDESSNQAHWRNREEGQPFFAIFNFTVSHESQIRSRPHTLKSDPAEAPLPAYHPDTPEVRHDWAQYYDKIAEMDAQTGRRLAELEEAGLTEETIIFFYSDHGSGMPRHKRWPYNSGLHVPLIIYVPEKFRHLAPADYRPGGTTDRMVGFVDLAPTLLSLAGLEPPAWMQGHAFMGHYEAEPRRHLFGFRGRMDERIDLVRSVRDGRYIYIRNYMPHLIYGQYLDYMFQTPTTRVWRELYDAGQLDPPQTYFWEPKPAEELYDLVADPDEVDNLVDAPEHRAALVELRETLEEHALAIHDVGLLPEAEMHRRAAAGGTTIYETARDPQHYPLERIRSMAEVAAARDLEAVGRLREGLADGDPAVRYWAATGILVRGGDAFQETSEAVRAALADENPSVRVVAAEILGTFGSGEEVEAAVDALAELAPADENGAYVAIAAVNVIDRLGERAARLLPLLAEMEVDDPDAPGRANGYVNRLVQHLTGDGN